MSAYSYDDRGRIVCAEMPGLVFAGSDVNPGDPVTVWVPGRDRVPGKVLGVFDAMVHIKPDESPTPAACSAQEPTWVSAEYVWTVDA